MFLNLSFLLVAAVSQPVSQPVIQPVSQPGDRINFGSTAALCALLTGKNFHSGPQWKDYRAAKREVSVVAGILTGDFSAGQVLRVPLLASGHRHVFLMSTARRALLMGWLSSTAAPAG